ncbi:MAG: type I 3-dehydroquinate dehydratase [Planctomycetaceae bacterium]|nr:type I 3-dehydroquinate dehydratase [Planctomycetaceae bacterium]
MICVTVTPKSRTLAPADILNAARHGDIIELCLDYFVKEPDIKDLLSITEKPMIVSCRRKEDGGHWQGTEEQRLMLLRQAIVAGPEYVELDLEIAPKVPRFGDTKRVISFTRLDGPETDIQDIFYQASNAKADIVKFTWPTPDLDSAWPLLAAVSQKRILPVVGMGLGRPELTFSLLGLKYGSPWIYAALEPGMESHPGQANVHELIETYHCQDIDSKTVFVAIAGFGPAQTLGTRILNAAFAELEMNVRCLPIELGSTSQLKKMLDILKIRAIVVKGTLGRQLLELADHIDKHDEQSQYINLLLKTDKGWNGYNTLWRAALKAVEQQFGGGSRPLDKRNVMVIGNGGIAQSMVHAVTQRKGLVSVCGPNDKEAQLTAATCGCRHVPFQNLYETLADVIIIADPNVKSGTSRGMVNPSVFQPNMTVIDVSNLPLETDLLIEARDRGCKVIDSSEIFTDQLKSQFRAFTGKDLPDLAIQSGMEA